MFLDSIIRIFIANPLLLLFAVAAVGYPLGQIRLGRTSLGVSAVLFVGLGAGMLHPDLKLPDTIYTLGLVLFVYTVGLGGGPGFFASFRRKGLRDASFAAGMLILAVFLTLIVHRTLGLRVAVTGGLFAGSLTNTPALASVLEWVKVNTPPAALDQGLTDPVVGYSIAYPGGVLGMLLIIAIMQRVWHVDYAREAETLREYNAANRKIDNRTIRVTRTAAGQSTVAELIQWQRWDVIFGRLRRGGQLLLSKGDTRLQPGDLVSVVGTPQDLDRVEEFLGECSDEQLALDRSELDYRRMFVSNPKVAGHRLYDLNLPQQYGAVVTRIRRGDIELLPRGDTVLELGDRVRVVTHRDNMEVVAKFFGDSYRAISEIDILAFSLGLALGLFLGTVPIPLPGGLTITLGLAGGPLIVALVLGALGRTGPIVWSLPYSANLTLRQIGLVLFLAGVGTRSGYAFLTTITQGGGLSILAAGALITCTIGFVTLLFGHLVLKIPMGLLTGMLAGIQTQPAVLSFAQEQAGNDLPNIGYATMYPMAIIGKIVLVQVLLALIR